MKSWKVLGIAGVVLAGLAAWCGTGQAQYFGPHIDQRQATQEQRLKEGILTGALTPHEAERLAAEQRRIQAAEARMRGDGRLDPRERAVLGHLKQNADRHLYQQTHDNQVAYRGYPNHRQPRYQHWQHNPGRHLGHGKQHWKGNGCDRRSAAPGHPGGFSRKPHGDRRFAWGH